MVEKMPPARPMSWGSCNRKPEGHLGQALDGDVHDDEDQDEQGEAGQAHSRVFIRVWTVRGWQTQQRLTSGG